MRMPFKLDCKLSLKAKVSGAALKEDFTSKFACDGRKGNRVIILGKVTQLIFKYFRELLEDCNTGANPERNN